MQYEIEVAGRARQVLVSSAGDRVTVSVDGRSHDVSVTRLDSAVWSLLVHETDADSLAGSFDVTVVGQPASGQLIVYVGATPIAVTANGRRRARRADEGSLAGPQRLTAPMPGKVVRVLAQPGDAVSARQPLVVIEAMKMENELRASRSGVVTEVRVSEGVSVEAGTLLVVVE